MGYVYLIGSPAFSQVKIGMSSGDPAKSRLSGLQVGNPFTLKLLWKEFTENPGELEAKLHEHFGAKHIRGEWFDLGDTPVSAFRDAIALHDDKSDELAFAREALAEAHDRDLKKLKEFEHWLRTSSPKVRKKFADELRKLGHFPPKSLDCLVLCLSGMIWDKIPADFS